MAGEEIKKKRKPGGGRKKSKPVYNPSAILQNQIEQTVALYSIEEHPSLQTIADELDINPIKVRKLLITAGVYKSEIADQVQRVFNAHRESDLSQTKAIAATMKKLNLSKASVTSYLPYEKGMYFPTETDKNNISVGAERIRRMRQRNRSVEKFAAEPAEEALWNCIVMFQGYTFHTVSGLPFTYRLKIGRDGEFTKELFIDRRENSKSLSWSSIRIAFERVMGKTAENPDVVFTRPKAIGDIRGISYIYSLLWRFGVITVPEEVRKKLRGE